MKKLSQIAECFNGYTFRARPSNLPGEDVHVVQMGDLALNNILNTAVPLCVSYQPDYDKFLLRKGDILFRGRGCFESVLAPVMAKMVVVASPLIIIRPNCLEIDPAYIVWLLNSVLAKQHFIRCGQGSVLKAIGVKELSQLNIPVPSLLTQQEIMKTVDLLREERKLLQDIQHRKEKWVTSALWRMANQQDQMRKK